ncbi:MAG TPA: hypothetical protein PKV16_04005 [Caldisericia bacterium]|nr:hypothetical protein [Caldisericia bacterium]HPF48474.1 hypothetical protein [Caldisericia bacterium]HPI83346.1 hypothetical protein [Caldisericia bacterium]HPQ92928.1 hypothetical protein [Caldisericia bacterium]HRV73974.1 hypothetical protein [Caldisericia bacterium]
MKKFTTLAIIATMVLGLVTAGTVFANDPGQVGPRDKAPQMPMMGTVVNINANDMTITPPMMDFMKATITFDEETKYYDGTVELEQGEEPPEVSRNDIKRDDKVVIRGKIVRDGEDENATTYYLAASVTKVTVFPRPGQGGKGGDQRPPTMNAILVKHQGDTLTVTDPAGENEHEVTVDENTKVFKVTQGEDGTPVREEIKYNQIQKGDKLVLTGKRYQDDDGNTGFYASVILVVDEFPANDGRGRGGDQSKERALLGTIVSVNQTSIVVLPNFDDAENVEIALSEKTVYVAFDPPAAEGEKPVKVEKTLADLKPGQKVRVTVIPARDGSGEPSPTAAVVVFLDEFPPARAGGEITAISSTSITITLRGRPDEEEVRELTLAINADTKFIKMEVGQEPVEITWSDLAVGDQVGIVHKDGVALEVYKSNRPESGNPPGDKNPGNGGGKGKGGF